MKKRFKNWITTVIGIVIMLLAVLMIVMNTFYGSDIHWTEVGITLGIGWIFLMARDEWIKGILGKVLGVKLDQ